MFPALSLASGRRLPVPDRAQALPAKRRILSRRAAYRRLRALFAGWTAVRLRYRGLGLQGGKSEWAMLSGVPSQNVS
jgi:hypothetical protein